MTVIGGHFTIFFCRWFPLFVVFPSVCKIVTCATKFPINIKGNVISLQLLLLIIILIIINYLITDKN